VIIPRIGKFAYVSNALSNTISVIDLATNTVVASIPSGGVNANSLDVNPNGKLLYVGNLQSNNVTVFDTKTRTQIASIPVTTPIDEDITTNGRFVYVSSEANNTLVAIDTRTNQPVATIPTGGTQPLRFDITP